MADCAQGATYHVRNRTDKRQRLSILTDVSAYFSPVKMSAVMGPSGSGAPSSKSRCLHVASLLHKVCEPVFKFQGHASPRAAVPLHRLRQCLIGCQLHYAPGPSVCEGICSCCCPAACSGKIKEAAGTWVLQDLVAGH